MVAVKSENLTIGAELRQLRLAQGLSLSDITKKTRLKTPYVQGIENMSQETLPSIGYVLGFVRTYATALGTDPDFAVKRYKEDIAAPKHIGMRERAIFVSKRKVKLPKGLLGAATVLILATSVSMWYASHTKADAQSLRQAALSTNGDFEVETATVTDPNIIQIKAIAPSWVRVMDEAGNITFSRIMVTGEVWRTKRDSQSYLSARDGGALEVFRGDVSLGILGPKGEVISQISVHDMTEFHSDLETEFHTELVAPYTEPHTEAPYTELPYIEEATFTQDVHSEALPVDTNSAIEVSIEARDAAMIQPSSIDSAISSVQGSGNTTRRSGLGFAVTTAGASALETSN